MEPEKRLMSLDELVEFADVFTTDMAMRKEFDALEYMRDFWNELEHVSSEETHVRNP